MKKKVIFGALAALFLGGGIVTTMNRTQKEQVSDLTLANIAAITMSKVIIAVVFLVGLHYKDSEAVVNCFIISYL